MFACRFMDSQPGYVHLQHDKRTRRRARAGQPAAPRSRYVLRHPDRANVMPGLGRLLFAGIFLSALVAAAVVAAPGDDSAIQDTPSPSNRAQTVAPTHAPPSPQKQVARLGRELKLTPDQAAAVAPILQYRQQQVEQLRASPSLTPHDLHRQMHASRQASETQLEAILTDAQRQQQLQQAAMQKHQNSRQGSHAPDNGGGPTVESGAH